MDQELERGFEHRLTAVEDRAASNTRRLDEVEKRQDDLEKLTASVSTLAANQKHMEGDVKEIKADVKSLAEKPGKRWDTMVDKIVWAVLAAVVAYILGSVGL